MRLGKETAVNKPKADARIQSRAKRGRPRGNGTQRVYDALRDEILMLSMAPGSHIDEARIESRFAISRTPIREALIRLQADGLVRFLPNRGYYVSSIDFTDLPRAFESLDLLQAAVLKLAALRRTEEDLAHMVQENASYLSASTARDHTAMTEANHRFHLVCGAAARNGFLASAYESVLNFNLRITRLAFATGGESVEGQAYYERIYSEHAQMIALIRARDGESLAALSRQHVQLFQGKIAAFLQSAAWLDMDVVEYEFDMA
jgi:DNA-binding GntR family transcriptional regulator